jgi:pyridoxine 5'-phosphate synthase PdxJ
MTFVLLHHTSSPLAIHAAALTRQPQQATVVPGHRYEVTWRTIVN